jgi:uncharacterized protein (TIGR04255 family)
MEAIKINIEEKFPLLASAPIVEAIIDIRAQLATPLEEGSIRSYLEGKIDGYSYLDSQHEFQHELKFDGKKPPEQTLKKIGWKGLRFQTADHKNIVQFNYDGFLYSRLAPYENWNSFVDEGLRHWQIFRELTQPVEINRIGLRFINRIELPPGEVFFEHYINPAPTSPRDLDIPFLGYLHQEKLAVPGYSYAINLIRTIQPPQDAKNEGLKLIFDIDVFTVQSFEYDEARITHALAEMRWLKNKAFFGSITEKALETLR